MIPKYYPSICQCK